MGGIEAFGIEQDELGAVCIGGGRAEGWWCGINRVVLNRLIAQIRSWIAGIVENGVAVVV